MIVLFTLSVQIQCWIAFNYYWLGVRKSIWSVKIQWWGVGVVICLERGAHGLAADATAIHKPHNLARLILI